MNVHNNSTQLPPDSTSPIEPFLNEVLSSLDSQLVSNLNSSLNSSPNSADSIVPQLHQQPRIIINGHPFGSKQQFQQLWSTLPLSQHQITSFDTHLIPSTAPGASVSGGQYIILAHLKVRFDESGRNKLGENADFSTSNNRTPNRPLWGNWFGASLSLVADGIIGNGFNCECISAWDYRITEKPDISLFKV